ncbi:MAG: aminopeptidase P N-terminal domain-containing protein [Planctomycetota bacterium]|nr:Xaa-Pro aminopeptidase [Planctomycetota bacterium]MDP6839651.1 aminopeptidase P N-terminal domain-containing protein [Planctomycetota bacterium]
MSMYTQHRARALEVLAGEQAAAVLFTHSLKTRNHDCDYRFRPESTFWHQSGFAEPDSVLVLLPGSSPERAAEEGSDQTAAPRSVLFLRPKDREKETWTGRRLGVEAAPEVLGVDEAVDIGELWTRLPELLKGRERIVYRFGEDADRDRRMGGVARALRALARGGVEPPVEWIDPAPLFHELRLFKSEAELVLMRRAAELTAEAHKRAMAATAPGVNEAEIDALIEYTFRRAGSTGCAYTNIVAGGAGACILHYVENDAPLLDGDLLLVDAGAEWDYYACDVTRTWPVNGTFNDEQRALYEVVLAAEENAIDVVAPGVAFSAVHEAALTVLVQGLLDLGLLSGSIDEALADETYKRFFMHKTSHWLGLDVHDCGAYTIAGEMRPLEPGMVFTVEPGLYVASDDESVEERWRGIGIRIEDDVLVTEQGSEVLTAAIPKTPAAVEAAVSGQLAAARS